MSKRYTDEFRADVVRVARNRGSGVTLVETPVLDCDFTATSLAPAQGCNWPWNASAHRSTTAPT